MRQKLDALEQGIYNITIAHGVCRYDNQEHIVCAECGIRVATKIQQQDFLELYFKYKGYELTKRQAEHPATTNVHRHVAIEVAKLIKEVMGNE